MRIREIVRYSTKIYRKLREMSVINHEKIVRDDRQLTHSFGPQRTIHCSWYISFGRMLSGGIEHKYYRLKFPTFPVAISQVLAISPSGLAGEN